MLSQLMEMRREGPPSGPRPVEPEPWDMIAESLIDAVMNRDVIQVKCVLRALCGDDDEEY